MKELKEIEKSIIKKYRKELYARVVHAVKDFSMEIDSGEFNVFVGPSGCGKSTLVKMLYREEKPTKGQVTVGGINVAKLYNSKVYKLRRKLGKVFQDFKLLPKLTVYENVAFGLENIGMGSSDIRKRVMKALERVGLKEKIRCFLY